jgi:MerR family transcriptional regulator, redox-sensitive transcriptional activator SoxR
VNELSLTIGQLAQRFGINASAIRYYERVGVLPPPAREGGRRRYGTDAIRRLETLQAAKQAGFTLAEAELLLQRSDAGDPLHEALRELAARKLPEVEQLLARTITLRTWLLAASACTCETLDACSLFAHGGGERDARS